MNTLLPARLATPCIHWGGALSPEGYGRIGDHGYAHRVAWEEASGEPIPAGLTIDHLCHNAAAARGECSDPATCLHRRCVNTDHLEPATTATNVLRGNSPWAVNARKTYCVRGHEFTEANTVWRRGVRECVECRKFWSRYAAGRVTAARTHCPQGHEYTPANTRWQEGKAGSMARRCRACVDERPTCAHGHPWAEENTDRRPDGSRRCRTCHRERERERHRRNREQRHD